MIIENMNMRGARMAILIIIMKAICTFVTSVVSLVTSDEERPTPWEENIKDIDALPIDGDILVGFGFEKLCDNYYYSKGDTFVMAQDNQLDVMDFFYNDKYGESASLGDIAYMHELQQALHEERNFIETFEPEWKGIGK